MKTPVLFLIHRRPALTKRVFEAIRDARPPVLLVAADGPSDDPRCQQTRDLVLTHVDWPCTVETRLLKYNEGCKRAVSGALDWAFSRHERLLVIEDDCLPSASFFRFCDELLERYENVPEVMQICGANLSGRAAADGSDYYASRFATIWGWASWRRAWTHYDVEMRNWPRIRASANWQKSCRFKGEARWRRRLYDEAHGGTVDAWSIAWTFAQQMQGGLSLIPSRNLVSNLGWGQDATHTHDANDPRAELPAESLQFPLRHPISIQADDLADRTYFERFCREPSLMRRVFNKFRRLATCRQS